MKKTLSHTPTYTWTETHHITIWLPDLPVGPEQPNQSSAGRTAMTMHNGWTKKEGGGRDENLVLSPVTFVDSQREGTAFFFEPTEGKSERENSLMQYNKVANLSSASLSTGDLEHYVYRNSQCSVWEVAKRRCVLSTERLYMLQISHRIKTRQVK